MANRENCDRPRIAMKTRLLLGALVVAGCSSESDLQSADDVEFIAKCEASDHELASQHYQRAIEGALERRSSGPCASPATHLRAIADHAASAVIKCPEFKQLIKSSSAAAPLREALSSSLTLRSLTDELRVIRDSQWQNWTSVERLLPGTSMSTEPQGSVGAHDVIVFGPDGAATFVTTALHVWESPATYTIEKTGTDKEPRRIVLTHEGQTRSFDLKIETPASDLTTAPLFRLVPSNARDVNPWETFSSLGPECR